MAVTSVGRSLVWLTGNRYSQLNYKLLKLNRKNLGWPLSTSDHCSQVAGNTDLMVHTCVIVYAFLNLEYSATIRSNLWSNRSSFNISNFWYSVFREYIYLAVICKRSTSEKYNVPLLPRSVKSTNWMNVIL